MLHLQYEMPGRDAAWLDKAGATSYRLLQIETAKE
ncbi:hypothetical protein FHS54_002466 [Sphingobium vermicomposti]|uniref:Uncharacterized protein n=1 Tax=Sphingobium vermicomposti TaxID=529005 RepID=A0A846M5H5_9SPHN|nr:hypothetical protein [Sphingobium vermicomposti]